MSLWMKLHTLFRATATEPLEHIVDVNAIRIFEQEIRDAENAIVQAKYQLATVMAEKKQLQRHNQALEENIANKERQTLAALEKNEEALAQDIAALIADDESLLADQRKQADYLQQQETHLKRQLRIAAQSIQKYQRELALAKANNSAQKALGQLKGYSSGLNASMQDMASSLERIQKRQNRAVDMDAALSEINAEMSGEQLDARLKQAGIKTGKHDAEAVLERLRKQRAA
ncbi:MAG TPA: PspA/IM30 family protein [Candidatus Kapabacteria bacterium]|nr:PspA/IM30 family protein [Candidatus Kapabacteria bacterium]